MLAPYRLTNLYVRAAVGEYLAMMFLPFIVMGVYLVFVNSSQRGALKSGADPSKDVRTPNAGRFGWLWVSIGIAGVVYSHILTTSFVLIFCLVAAVIGLVFRPSRWAVLQMGKCVLCTLLLSAAFVTPFLDFMATNDLQMSQFGLEDQIAYFDRYSLQPVQLLLLDSPMTGLTQSLQGGIYRNSPANIGWALLPAVVL